MRKYELTIHSMSTEIWPGETDLDRIFALIMDFLDTRPVDWILIKRESPECELMRWEEDSYHGE